MPGSLNGVLLFSFPFSEPDLVPNVSFRRHIVLVYFPSSPGSSFRTRFMVCFILPIKKLISSDDSVSCVYRSGITRSVRTSPKCWIFVACFVLSVSRCSSSSSRLSSLTFAKVSIMAKDMSRAISPFRIVAKVALRFFTDTFVVNFLIANLVTRSCSIQTYNC